MPLKKSRLPGILRHVIDQQPKADTSRPARPTRRPARHGPATANSPIERPSRVANCAVFTLAVPLWPAGSVP